MAYGEYAKAQPLAEKALTLARTKEASDSELAMCFIDLATLYTYQGKLVDAEEMCKSGLQLQEKILCKNHPYLAYTLRILSSIYYEQGEYYKAKSALDEAVVIVLNSHIADDQAMTPFLVDIARVLVVQGDLQQAESYYQKAMLLINTSYGPNHLYTASVLAGMAKLYTLQERYSEAEQLVIQSLAVQERVYGPNHHLIAGTWLTMAEICKHKGDYVQQENLISKAVTAVEKTGNLAELAKIQQRIAQIRGDKQVALADISRTVR